MRRAGVSTLRFPVVACEGRGMLIGERAVGLERGRPEVVVRRRATTQYARLALLVGITDALSLLLVSGLAREVSILVGKGHQVHLKVLLLPLVALPVFALMRLYHLSQLSPAEEFKRLPAAVSVSVATMVVIAFWFGFDLSRTWIAISWLFGIVTTLAERRAWHAHMGRARASGALVFRTFVVGTNEEARRIAASLGTGASGFEGVGFVAVRSDYVRLDGLPVIGLPELEAAVADRSVDCLYIASTAVLPEDVARVMKTARRTGTEVRISANMTEILASRLMVQPVGRLLALCLQPAHLTGRQAALKRTFDMLVAGLILLVVSPVWTVSAVLIKLTSRGPVLFRQERIGRSGERFRIFKFRTMVVGADRMRARLDGLNEASGPLFKVRNDPRVTTAGRWLRRWSLDELPQLLNVLRGEMSLVGPRPPLAEEVAKYEEWHYDRLAVPPGMTGLWQVSGRSELSFDDYVRLDLFYVENWSLSYDLFILLKTIPAVFARRGAF